MRASAVLAVLVRPRLWLEACRVLSEIRCKEWWQRLLLVPESEYLRWRTMTAYGDPDARITSDDLVRYLRWRQRQRVE